MKRYGLIVADNGSDMYITGTMDARWNNDVLNPAFHSLTADDFEVVSARLGAQSRLRPAPTNLADPVGRVRANAHVDCDDRPDRSRAGVALVDAHPRGTGRRRAPSAPPASTLPGRFSRTVEQRAAFGRLHLSAADRGQHADDAPHHLPEKVRALHADQNQRAGFDELEALEHDDRGLLVGVVVGEGGEVVACRRTRRPRARIAARSSGSRIHQTNGLANAVRRREI